MTTKKVARWGEVAAHGDRLELDRFAEFLEAPRGVWSVASCDMFTTTPTTCPLCGARVVGGHSCDRSE